MYLIDHDHLIEQGFAFYQGQDFRLPDRMVCSGKWYLRENLLLMEVTINHQVRYAPVVANVVYIQAALLTKTQLEEVLKLEHWQRPLIKATKQFTLQRLF